MFLRWENEQGVGFVDLNTHWVYRQAGELWIDGHAVNADSVEVFFVDGPVPNEEFVRAITNMCGIN